MHMTNIIAKAKNNSSSCLCLLGSLRSGSRSLRSGLNLSSESTTAPARASASTTTRVSLGVESSGQVHAFFTAVRRIYFSASSNLWHSTTYLRTRCAVFQRTYESCTKKIKKVAKHQDTKFCLRFIPINVVEQISAIPREIFQLTSGV